MPIGVDIISWNQTMELYLNETPVIALLGGLG